MLNIIESAVIYIVNFTCAYLVYDILREFLSARKQLVLRVMAIILLSYIVGMVIFPEEVLISAGTIAGLLLVIALFYQGDIIEKLSCGLILFPLILSVNYLTEDIGLQIYVHIFQEEMSLTASTVLHSITLLLRIPFWFFIWKYAKKWIARTTHLMTPKMWLVVDTLCITSAVSILSVINSTKIEDAKTAYPAVIASIFTSVGCCYLCAYIARTIYTGMEIENLKYQQSYYNELEENQENIKKLRHDMKNHLNIIGSLIEDQDFNNAKKYFTSLSGEFETSARSFCRNSIVNAVLNSKYNRAVQHQIDCFFHIDIDAMLAMDDVNLCSLFANTLDNAIEACLKIQDASQRKISMKARYRNGAFSFELVNSRQGQILLQKGEIVSQKDDQANHGIGLKNVRSIVEKYGGNIDISYADDSFTVVVFIGNL